jgi:hypothetical protein
MVAFVEAEEIAGSNTARPGRNVAKDPVRARLGAPQKQGVQHMAAVELADGDQVVDGDLETVTHRDHSRCAFRPAR